MPFNPFKRKKEQKTANPPPSIPQQTPTQVNDRRQNEASKLTFHAQLAHGSPTAKLAAFTNLKELYKSISVAFSIPIDQILFCTLNTHKCDMDRLIGGQIGLEDFIFAHVKGEQKDCRVVKSEISLGLTITDNGNGYPFVKRIKKDSVVEKTTNICVGDVVQSINNISTIGMRHFQVAKTLRELELNSTFVMSLVEPKKAFEMISQRGAGKVGATPSTANITSGKSTLRLRSHGPATIEDLPTAAEEQAIGKIDDLLESFMGIRDGDLAKTIWECGKDKVNPDQFLASLDAEVGEFGFPQDFIFDVWGVMKDTRVSS